MRLGLYTQNWYCTLDPPVAAAVRAIGVPDSCGDVTAEVTFTAVSGAPE